MVCSYEVLSEKCICQSLASIKLASDHSQEFYRFDIPIGGLIFAGAVSPVG
jgi:hypothetical protein